MDKGVEEKETKGFIMKEKNQGCVVIHYHAKTQ